MGAGIWKWSGWVMSRAASRSTGSGGSSGWMASLTPPSSATGSISARNWRRRSQRLEFESLTVHDGLEVAQPFEAPGGVVGRGDPEAVGGIVLGDDLGSAAGEVAGQVGDDVGRAGLPGEAQVLRREEFAIQPEPELHERHPRSGPAGRADAQLSASMRDRPCQMTAGTP